MNASPLIGQRSAAGSSPAGAVESGTVRQWGTRRWQRLLAGSVATVLVLLCSQSISPTPKSVQGNWQAGFALANIDRLNWGEDIVFTHGPLGLFTYSPAYFYGQLVLATAYQIALLIALFFGVVTALRGRVPPLDSLIISFAALAVTAILALDWSNFYLAVVVAFVWAAVPLLRDDAENLTVWKIAVLLGVFAGFQFLAKVNTGVYVLAIALAMSCLYDWRSVTRHFVTLGSFSLSVVGFWVLSGQSLRGLPEWARRAEPLILGHGEAMSVAIGLSVLPGLALAAAWLITVAVLWLFGAPALGRRYLMLVLVVTAMAIQTAFARANPDHFRQLLGFVIVATAITPMAAVVRRVRLGAVAAGVLALCCAANLIWLSPFKDDDLGPRQFFERLATLARPGSFDQRIEAEKRQQRDYFDVPSRYLDMIGSGSVHVDPFAASVIWAYNLRWRPVPVFQTYLAFNPILDRLNSESLDHRTDFVLSRRSEMVPALSGNKLGVQESPLYTRTLLCNFTVAATDAHWTLLARSSPHCAPLRLISEVDAADDEKVAIPAPSAPGRAVLVGIDLKRTSIDRLLEGAGALLPLNSPTITLDANTYPAVAANLVDPFLVRSPESVAGTNLEISAHFVSVGSVRERLRTKGIKRHFSFYEMATDSTTG